MSSEKDKKFEDLLASDEFRRDLQEIADCMNKTKQFGLAVGRIADKWIGDRRYSRALNAETFAAAYTEVTGRKLSGRRVRDYINAANTQTFLEEAGVECADLTVEHLDQIAKSRCESDEERVELARRVNEKDVTARQIRPLAQRLHAELRQERRTVDVVTTEARVQVIDAMDLLTEQEDGSIECAIIDWEWLTPNWSKEGRFPQVHVPADPVDHLCRCLTVLKAKLAPMGVVFLFHSSFGFMDKRIQETCARIGIKHVGKVIWQKTSGSYQNLNTMLRIAHEEVHLLCHADYTPKSLNGGCCTVTPKWGSPTSAASGQLPDAVHVHQKPVALMDLLIRISTVNGLVADLFAGSGAAGIAAVRRGCSYIGAELIPEIAETANRRIALANGENEEVVDAINFFLEGATDEQFATIAAALEKCSLHCVRKALGRAAA